VTDRVNALTGYALTDAFCGFKAYRLAALRKMELDEPSYGMPLQVWIQAAHHGLRVREIPIGRIYKNPERRFWGGLDDPALRRAYYLDVLRREAERWLGKEGIRDRMSDVRCRMSDAGKRSGTDGRSVEGEL
jgi:dolichol-phosphate mannosyltransferase